MSELKKYYPVFDFGTVEMRQDANGYLYKIDDADEKIAAMQKRIDELEGYVVEFGVSMDILDETGFEDNLFKMYSRLSYHESEGKITNLKIEGKSS